MQDLAPFESMIEAQGAMRDKIMLFEQALSEQPGAFVGESDEFPVVHEFADGLYIRSLHIPKGGCITGKIHRFSHPSFLMKGEISIVSESGGVQRLKAPCMVIAPSGTKRVGYAHEDTVWTTVHATKETDLKKIEAEVIAPSFEDFERGLLCPS